MGFFAIFSFFSFFRAYMPTKKKTNLFFLVVLLCILLLRTIQTLLQKGCKMKRLLIIAALLVVTPALKCADDKKQTSATAHFACAAGKYTFAASQVAATAGTFWLAHKTRSQLEKDSWMKEIPWLIAAVAAVSLPHSALNWILSGNESVKKGLAAQSAK